MKIQFMLGKFKMVKETVKEFKSTKMDASLKDSGKTTFAMEKHSKGTLMVTVTMATLSEAKLTVTEFIVGLMERSMMVLGVKDSSKVMESGKVHKMTLISASGFSRKRMGMVFTHGKMVINMKALGRCALSMVQAQIKCIMVTHTLVSIVMANLMVKDNTPGVLGQFI